MLKRIFWLVLGAAIVWFYSRSEMDELYSEISQLREADRERESASE